MSFFGLVLVLALKVMGLTATPAVSTPNISAYDAKSGGNKDEDKTKGDKPIEIKATPTTITEDDADDDDDDNSKDDNDSTLHKALQVDAE